MERMPDRIVGIGIEMRTINSNDIELDQYVLGILELDVKRNRGT